MNLKTLTFLSIVIAIYGLINYYIALRGCQALGGNRLPLYLRQYWFWIVIFMSALFPLSRIAGHFLPLDLSRIFIMTASYWLGIMYYLLLIIISLDFIRLLDRWLAFLPEKLKTPHPGIFLGIIICILMIQVYGTWNARHPVIREYEITVPQKSSSLSSMRIVMVSDIHLGWIIGVDQLNAMIKKVNVLEPDLVLLAGDIVDEGVDFSAEKKIPERFRTLQPRMGTFAVLGNHEYISGQADAVTTYLGQGGVKVLRDEWVEVNMGFYVVGRDDLASQSFTGNKRRDLASVMKGMDKDRLPILLLDHQPSYLGEAQREGVDIQFSGHTHRGQIAPNNLITRKIFEQDWGYLQKENLQVIVSCGFGTWGPPIRIGNQPEIVNIKVNFIPANGKDQ